MKQSPQLYEAPAGVKLPDPLHLELGDYLWLSRDSLNGFRVHPPEVWNRHGLFTQWDRFHEVTLHLAGINAPTDYTALPLRIERFRNQLDHIAYDFRAARYGAATHAVMWQALTEEQIAAVVQQQELFHRIRAIVRYIERRSGTWALHKQMLLIRLLPFPILGVGRERLEQLVQEYVVQQVQALTHKVFRQGLERMHGLDLFCPEHWVSRPTMPIVESLQYQPKDVHKQQSEMLFGKSDREHPTLADMYESELRRQVGQLGLEIKPAAWNKPREKPDQKKHPKTCPCPSCEVSRSWGKPVPVKGRS